MVPTQSSSFSFSFLIIPSNDQFAGEKRAHEESVTPTPSTTASSVDDKDKDEEDEVIIFALVLHIDGP